MGDLRMELDAIDGLRIVSDGSKWSSLCSTNDMEILGEILKLISVGHPNLANKTRTDDQKSDVMSQTRDGYLHFIAQIREQRIDRALTESGNLNGRMAVLPMITFRDLTFEIPRDFLSSIVGGISEASSSGQVAGGDEPAIHSKCQESGHQVQRLQDRHVARRNRTPSTVILRE
jgi:hypothetical protein